MNKCTNKYPCNEGEQRALDLIKVLGNEKAFLLQQLMDFKRMQSESDNLIANYENREFSYGWIHRKFCR